MGGGSSAHIDARPAVVFIGDSITEEGSSVANGFVLQLSTHFSRRADVLNRGLSGYNTRWVLKVFDRSWPPHETTALAVLWFGNNDMADAELGTPMRHVPLEEFKANLASIIARTQSKCSRVVVISPVPIHEANYRKEWFESNPEPPIDRTLATSGAYAAAAQAAASEAGCVYLDLWSKFQAMTFDQPAQEEAKGDEQAKDESEAAKGDEQAAEASSPLAGFFHTLSGADLEVDPQENQAWGRLLRDGLHLSEEGNRVVAHELVALINYSFPKFLEWSDSTDSLQRHLPSCGDVTAENQDTIFGAEAPAAEEPAAEAPLAEAPGAEAGAGTVF